MNVFADPLFQLLYAKARCLCSFVSICWQSLMGGKSFELSLLRETAATGCTAGVRQKQLV